MRQRYPSLHEESLETVPVRAPTRYPSIRIHRMQRAGLDFIAATTGGRRLPLDEPVECDVLWVDYDLFTYPRVGAARVPENSVFDDTVEAARTFMREMVRARAMMVSLSCLRSSGCSVNGRSFYFPPYTCDTEFVIALIDVPIRVTKASGTNIATDEPGCAPWSHTWTLIRDITLPAAKRHRAFVVCDPADRPLLRLQPNDWLYKTAMPATEGQFRYRQPWNAPTPTAGEDGYMLSERVSPSDAASIPADAFRHLLTEAGMQ